MRNSILKTRPPLGPNFISSSSITSYKGVRSKWDRYMNQQVGFKHNVKLAIIMASLVDKIGTIDSIRRAVVFKIQIFAVLNISLQMALK